MLNLLCKTCNGNGMHHEWNEEKKQWDACTADGCNHGQVEADENMKVYVNVYSVTREFGGHEEGGWYYNRFVCLETVPCKNKYSDEIQEDLEKEYEGRKHGNIYSVLGGTLIEVYIEEKRCESETRERPQYE